MADLIDRQMAIDAIEVTPFDNYGDYLRARDIIDLLPSAQSDKPEWVKSVEQWYIIALRRPHIKKPLAWALYQTWEEYDNE